MGDRVLMLVGAHLPPRLAGEKSLHLCFGEMFVPDPCDGAQQAALFQTPDRGWAQAQGSAEFSHAVR